ncbi:MAG: dihydrodipicolinate synthase family protein [Gemmatimonadales bacterium]
MDVRARLREGLVIPAHPLALTARRRLDERHQRALTRYYIDAGAGGLAVGVHTTQFAIHDPAVGLYRPVLQLALETAKAWRPGRERPVMIAGVIGRTRQAMREASLARDLGYHAALLGLAAFRRDSDAAMIRHARAVAGVIPIIGFYLQPAVGGRMLGYRYWRRLCEIDNLVAIKVAPFDRYATLDVMRAIADSGRAGDIALYTGNDDHIILDLLARFRSGRDTLRMVGGLLGNWAFWTRRAVEYHRRCRALAQSGNAIPASMLTLAARITEANAAVFDPANAFHGCIPGIHEILRRQGLLAGRWCLDPAEKLSPGQIDEIDRVCEAYPELTDDEFVAQRRDLWLA